MTSHLSHVRAPRLGKPVCENGLSTDLPGGTTCLPDILARNVGSRKFILRVARERFDCLCPVFIEVSS